MEARMPTKGPSKITVDFSGVEERREGGGRAAHVPEGDYLLRVEACELKSKKDDATSKYLNWRVTIAAPEKYKNAGSIWHTTTLKQEGLWSLRNFLEDLGVSVPKSAVDIPFVAIAAKHPIIGATLEDHEYNNKVTSRIAATFKKAAYEATDEADDDEDATDEDAEATAAVSEDEDEELEEIDVDDL